MSSRGRRRPRHRPRITVMAKTPAEQYRQSLAALLPRERAMADRVAANVETVAELAVTLTGNMVKLLEMRASMVGLATALSKEDPSRPFDVPPSSLGISDTDPDGVLYAALTSGDARAVAEALGKLAGAALSREGAHGGR